MNAFDAEIRRRTRSLFATLRAIVRRSSTGEESREEFAALLESRIGALARVHDMLMRAPDEGIDLAEMVDGELLAQTVPEWRYRATGPDTRICNEVATSIGLMLHELSVNALIHGAFASKEGKVEITWAHLDRNGGRWLRLSWQESGVATSGDAPTIKGFGLELMERSLPYELGACTSIGWSPPGMRAEILLPAATSVVQWRPSDRAIAV